MALAQRLRQVEKCLEKAGIGKQRVSFIVVCESGATKEEQDKSIAEYKANHPSYLENDINYVNVPNEHSKQFTEVVINGKGAEGI